MSGSAAEELIGRLTGLRQFQQQGHRAPHKPLLVLMALAALINDGSSELEWATVEAQLGPVIGEFGRASRTNPAQTAAYPFTHLRSDGVWVLNREVPMDKLGPLRAAPVTGRFPPDLEAALLTDRTRALAVARDIVAGQFPESLAADVLTAVGLDPGLVLGLADAPAALPARRRSVQWRQDVLQAWDRSCAFCGFDGELGGAPVAIEAAHVRWFNFDGPDDPDNGLALCSLHHKLFDRGVLGLDGDARIAVSSMFTARTEAGKRVYDLQDVRLSPRRGTVLPAHTHITWHRSEVFKGDPLAA